MVASEENGDKGEPEAAPENTDQGGPEAAPENTDQGGPEAAPENTDQGEPEAALENTEQGESEVALDNTDESSVLLEDNGQSVSKYDFAHPDHQLNQSLPGLSNVDNKLVVISQSQLQQELHVTGEVLSTGIDTIRFEDYASKLTKKSTVYSFSMEPLTGTGLLMMDHALVRSLVHSYFGGSAGGSDAESEQQRALSVTELRIADRVRDCLFRSLAEVWREIVPIEIQNHGVVPHADIAQATQKSSVVVVSSFRVASVGSGGEFSVLLPYSTLVPIRRELAGLGQNLDESDRVWSAALRRRIDECAVDVNGVLAESQITVADLLALSSGDFVPLGSVENATFYAANSALFEAAIGVSNGHVSASFSHWHSSDVATNSTNGHGGK